MYTLNNPLKFVDPDGDAIIVVEGDEQWNYYDLIELSESDLAELPSSVRRIVASIKELLSKEEGQKLVQELADNEYRNLLKHAYKDWSNRAWPTDPLDANDVTKGFNTKIEYNSYEEYGGLDVDGSSRRPPFIGLAHELIHALHFNRGEAVPGETDKEVEQRRTIEHENKIRGEHDITARDPDKSP